MRIILHVLFYFNLQRLVQDSFYLKVIPVKLSEPYLICAAQINIRLRWPKALSNLQLQLCAIRWLINVLEFVLTVLHYFCFFLLRTVISLYNNIDHSNKSII